MIKAQNIHKSFGKNKVLNGIDFIFEEGKVNLIIGQSGAGKTVFLKILVGLIEPTQGKVLYNDTDLCSISKKELNSLRQNVGMLFQGNALFDSLTIEQNVRFPLDMFTKLSSTEKKKRVNECLEQVELKGVNKKYPDEISGGMQKRVGIARAIVLNPDYLFCDEPNSGLDPKTAITIDKLIVGITKSNNMTTIINTHDMNSVMGIGENICLLDKGQIAWQGTNNDVLESKNEKLQNFIFASPFLQQLKDKALQNR